MKSLGLCWVTLQKNYVFQTRFANAYTSFHPTYKKHCVTLHNLCGQILSLIQKIKSQIKSAISPTKYNAELIASFPTIDEPQEN
mgnify:CR=1 FL=1